MKPLKIILILLLFHNLNAQTEVELAFWDSCTSRVFKTEYEAHNLNNVNEYYLSTDSKVTLAAGRYLIVFGKLEGELIKSSQQILEVKDLKKINDTLILPKIVFTSESIIHFKNWNYYNCEMLCNGYQADFYPNGNLKLEGIFEQGKPSEITEFRENGSKQTKYWYRLGSLDYLKVDSFDENGNLEEYEIYKKRKNKTTKSIYNSKDKLLRKE